MHIDKILNKILIQEKEEGNEVFLNEKTLNDKFIDCLEFHSIFRRVKVRENPKLNLARAFRYKYKYNLSFSNQLRNYVDNWLNNFDNKLFAINYLKDIEFKYKTSIID